MALALAAEGQRRERGGLRPMNPARDLGAITSLIASAFADDLDERARSALREMRWMSRMSPLVWWWSQTDPQFRDSLNGFVWEEPLPGTGRRRIVGNVSLNRAPGDPRRWIVCNVAVLPEYRRRGIARRLTEAALAQAYERGADGVVLQVYKDNLPAMRLYRELGFREAAGETALWLGQSQAASAADAALTAIGPSGSQPRGCEVRDWRRADRLDAYDLARRTTAIEQQWLVPIRPGDYGQDAWSRVGEWLAETWAGRRTYRLVALKERRLAGLATVAASVRGPAHSLRLLVGRDRRGQVERALISRALAVFSRFPRMPLWATVDHDHAAGAEELRRVGFQEKRTLLTLRKDMA